MLHPSSPLSWARVTTSLGQKLSVFLRCQWADVGEGSLRDGITCAVPAPHLHRCSIRLHTPAQAGGLPPPRGRLLPNYFFAVLRDRAQMLWQLEMKIFHVPLSEKINRATWSCLYPVLTRNMQFLLTAFKGPAVNSVKWNG